MTITLKFLTGTKLQGNSECYRNRSSANMLPLIFHVSKHCPPKHFSGYWRHQNMTAFCTSVVRPSTCSAVQVMGFVMAGATPWQSEVQRHLTHSAVSAVCHGMQTAPLLQGPAGCHYFLLAYGRQRMHPSDSEAPRCCPLTVVRFLCSILRRSILSLASEARLVSARFARSCTLLPTHHTRCHVAHVQINLRKHQG